MRPVSIVIPVYKDFSVTKRCIESVLPVLDADVRLVVVNDSSPEQEVADYCEKIARLPHVELITHVSNQGFVVSVNEGMSRHPESDVVLLNSDTQVFNDWLQRLQVCAYQTQDTGTVTPFSNNATICSYPLFPEGTELPHDLPGDELDSCFARCNAQKSVEIPTAVGFCMYIRRDCLHDVGLFDADTFGRGYGEECDFSCRAVKKGWRNMQACDLFVYHEGGVSFGIEAVPLKETADKAIAGLHPDYHKVVERFIAEDPARQYRQNVDKSLIAARPALAGWLLDIQYLQGRAQGMQLTAYLSALAQETEQRLEESVKYQQLLQESRDAFEVTDKALADVQQLAKSQQEMISQKHAELDAKQQELKQLAQALHCLRGEHQQVLNSRSWRYTAPIRKLLGKV